MGRVQLVILCLVCVMWWGLWGELCGTLLCRSREAVVREPVWVVDGEAVPQSAEFQQAMEDGQPIFLYLIQTESCLPEHLASPGVFGDGQACRCHVLVLGYQRQCTNSSLPHTEHIFKPSTTWATGRNILVNTAMKRTTKYLYYIFMDDDIDLQMNSGRNINPWRLFENFLVRVEPAVAAVDDSFNPCLPAIYRARKRLNCSISSNIEYIPAVRYDAAFNAFHYEALPHLLPYAAKYDNMSWWAAQAYVVINAEIKFRGQVVLHTWIRGYNPVHRPYPQRKLTDKDLLPILEDIARKLPAKYQDSKVLQHWKRDGVEHQFKSSTLCLPPPLPHKPIMPYSQFSQSGSS